MTGASAATQTFDLIIRNGAVYDGSGGDAYASDIGVSGVRDVVVNGVAALRDGEFTGAFPGRAVYGAGKRG